MNEQMTIKLFFTSYEIYYTFVNHLVSLIIYDIITNLVPVFSTYAHWISDVDSWQNR